MKKLDIKLSDKVVCYDTGNMQFFGFRAAWMLESFGQQNVFVLDGGFPKWLKEGRPVEPSSASSSSATEQDYAYKLNKDKIKYLA